VIAKYRSGVPDTKEILLRTAERMFAERGISVVSLREIGEKAEQRNTAVVHYHFGDKDGLVRAIFEYRASTINARRDEMVGALSVANRQNDLAGLCNALVLPLAEQVNDSSRYVGFLARLQAELEWTSASPNADPVLSSSFRRTLHLIRESLNHLPNAAFESRAQLAGSMIPQALAAHQVRRYSHEPQPLPIEDFVPDLVRVVTALFSAPFTQ
jgi:AcrR family transcriptional regulator